MNRKILKRLLIVAAAVLLLSAATGARSRPASTVRAFGHLIVDLGVPSGQPIFTVSDFKPGDCQTRDVDVTNSGTKTAKVAVRSDGEIDDDGLSAVFSIVIRENSTDLYGGTSITGPKKLADFFADSSAPDGIILSTIAPGETKTYYFEICFDAEAGNDYQADSVIFDIIFGEILVPVELPEVCDDLEGTVTEKIEGTPGNDDIRGTIASELIEGFEGDDKIDGGGGHDCIIGGPGKDEIDGGSGNDIISGDGEDDKIDGGSGNDTIFGGEGNDEIEGGSDNDYIEGNGGNDKIEGGAGVDTVYGGEGEDNIGGGSGNDFLSGGPGADIMRGGSDKDTMEGNEGNDNMRGNSDDDSLDGGPDTDSLDGDSGIDTCVNGEALTSCEL